MSIVAKDLSSKGIVPRKKVNCANASFKQDNHTKESCVTQPLSSSLLIFYNESRSIEYKYDKTINHRI